MAPTGLPPPVDPRELRPRRAWYAVAAVIAALGVCAFPVLAALGVGAVGSLKLPDPASQAEFRGTEPVTVALSADRTWAIYATPIGSAPKAAVRCTVEGAGTVDLKQVAGTVTVSVNGRSWEQLYTFTVGAAGDYQVRCAESDAVTAAGYAVGEDPNIGGFLAGVFGGAGAFVGAILVPCGGLLVGGLVGLVVLLSRLSHRRRLKRQRTGFG